MVEAVASAEDAMVAAEGGRFDLILADAGILGGETAGRLAAVRALALAAAPAELAIMVADAREDEVAGFIAAGAVQIIRKPIAAPVLADQLRSGLAVRREAASDSPNISVA